MQGKIWSRGQKFESPRIIVTTKVKAGVVVKFNPNSLWEEGILLTNKQAKQLAKQLERNAE